MRVRDGEHSGQRLLSPNAGRPGRFDGGERVKVTLWRESRGNRAARAMST